MSQKDIDLLSDHFVKGMTMETCYGDREVSTQHDGHAIRAREFSTGDGKKELEVIVTVDGHSYSAIGHRAWALVGVLRSFVHLVETGMK